MKRVIFILLFFLPCMANPQVGLATKSYSDDMIFKFADFLFGQKEYQRAIVEYKRFMFLQGHAVDSLILKIGLCYIAAKDYPLALSVFDQLPEDGMLGENNLDVRMCEAFSFFSLFRYQNALNVLDQVNTKSECGPCCRTKLSLFMAANYLALHEWSAAQQLLSKAMYDTCAPGSRIAFWELLEEGPNMQIRNAICAGILSGIVPGMGKIYAGRKIDGLFSLVLISFLAWESYDGFVHDDLHSTKGWSFGTVGAVFYLGNIYGSYLAVKVNNQEFHNEFISKIQLQLDQVIGF